MGIEIYLLALVLVMAAFLAVLTFKLKQPLLVAYVLTGALLSAFHIIKPEQLEFLAILPEVGLAFLLFLVGMELDLQEFRKLGKNILLVTIGQILITTLLVGFLTKNPVIGLVTGFTSTILVVKILIEEKEVSSLHGKIAIGSLLVEDLLAVLVLMFLAVSTSGSLTPGALVSVMVKGVLLIYFSLVAGKKILPKIFDLSAKSSELLFLTAISWCLTFVSLSIFSGFSLAIGAFLAGVSLAQSVYRIQISGKIKPLRDFFIMIFFLDLGTGLSISGLGANMGLALGILFFAVVIKPLIFMLLLSLLRYRIHTAFQTGVFVSSISEFSLIVIVTASKYGILDTNLLSPLIFATVFSFVLSSFEINHRRKIYEILKNMLKKFERGKMGSSESISHIQSLNNHAVLIGCHRSGQIILKGLMSTYDNDLVVLDFNPDVIEDLRSSSVDCLYGDVSDPEVLENLNLPKAQIVISTVRDLHDNLVLLDFLEKVQSRAVILMTAEDLSEAIKLYEKGAHYVSLSMDLEGLNIARMIHEHVSEPNWFIVEKDKRLGEAKTRYAKVHSA